MKKFFVGGAVAVALAGALVAADVAFAADDIFVSKAGPISYGNSPGYDWTGFYAGGHMGYSWGSSNWTAAPDSNGSIDLFQLFDPFKDTGSFFEGVQAGYNYMLPNRVVLGAEVDTSFPPFPNSTSGFTIGGRSTWQRR